MNNASAAAKVIMKCHTLEGVQVLWHTANWGVLQHHRLFPCCLAGAFKDSAFRLGH